MALDFPSPPYDGEIYVDPVSNSKYIYVASKSTWKSIQHIPVTTAFGFDKANSAYLTANAAYDMANAAYNSQNVDYTLSNSAFAHANAAYDFSNSAYASINSNWTVQNALYTVANASFAVANAALPNVSNAVFEGNLRVTGVLQVGSNTITITNNHIIANDYFRVNTGGHRVAVTDGNIVNAVFDLVNVSFNTANASYASANNVGPQIAPTYNTANAAFDVANSGFAKANTSLQNTSGTFVGSLNTTGTVTANSFVYITPTGGEEGGEIQLLATGSNTKWSIDSYQNSYRVFAATGSTVSNMNFFHAATGSVKFAINKTGPLATLDVNGDIRATTSANAFVAFDNNGGYPRVDFYDQTPVNILGYIQSDGLVFNGAAGAERMRIDSSGHLRPGSDNTYDLGSTSYRWRNIYTADAHFSNEGTEGNSIDGTTGNWTLQEGDENLYLLNNKTGKKYKFVLQEIV